MTLSGERKARRRVIKVTPQAVDAARARVNAYKVLGITPDPHLAKLAAVSYTPKQPRAKA